MTCTEGVGGCAEGLEIVLYTLEVVNGVRRVRWVMRVMLCTMFCILEAVEGELCLLGVMRCALFCMLEAVGG